VISRGVAPIVDLLKWSDPLLAKNNSHKETGPKSTIARGSVLMLKGGDLTSEISDARKRYPRVQIEAHPLEIKGNHTLEGKQLVVAQL
jgi:hypothetical protein